MSFTGRDQTFLNKTLTNSEFYPDIKLSDFQEQYRIATSYSQSMVENTLKLAMIEINQRLDSQKQNWLANGLVELYQVPNQGIEDGAEFLYIAAVCHWAKAELMRQFATVTDRKTSDATSASAEENETYYRQRADQYVRQILGKTGITCELL